MNFKVFKNYCNCGGCAGLSDRAKSEHPHMSWCAQYKEFCEWKEELKQKALEQRLMINAKGHLSDPAYKFNYRDPAPRATKLNILTRGNTCITSDWQDNLGHKAWARLPDRDIDEEIALGMAQA